MAARPAIPKRLEKALYQEANSRCMICREDEISTLVIHHIVPFSETPDHKREDLIVLCANCHAQADRGEITKEQLYKAKRSLAKVVPIRPRPTALTSKTVIGPGIIVAGGDIIAGGDIKVHVPRMAGKPRPPVIPDTVATDPYKVGYLKYLVRRYMEFKEHEVGKEKMRYPVIYKAYQREIGFSIEQTPLQRFVAAYRYLQQRIENTKLGRIRKGRGQRLYSAFEEFVKEDME